MPKEIDRKTKKVNIYQFKSYPIENCNQCQCVSWLDMPDPNESGYQCRLSFSRVTPYGIPNHCPLKIVKTIRIPRDEILNFNELDHD